ncbi:MAG TPA: MauE/DoxX family redox-associated membrane protein, partial [Verrucomicrobiae bacterium]|nr:MauE/DoxX family redox-associated membrane protein [Verrucomicrobiae bacterium]
VSNDLATRYRSFITLYLRLALGIGFLSAVADRFGWWGPPGTPNVAWGTFNNFLIYTAKLNPWFSGGWIPAIGWAATVCEICCGLMLIIGYRTRLAAVFSGLLTLAFAIGMVCGLGIHAPLNYSVFVVSAGSFLLADVGKYPLSLDSWRETMRYPVAAD